MSTSNFSLPGALKTFLDEQADSILFFILIAIFFLMTAGGVTLVAQEPSSALAAALTASPEPPPQDAPDTLVKLKGLSNVVPTPIKTERIDRAGEEIGFTIGQIERRASLVLGTWVTQECFRGITWFMMLVCLLLFLFVLAVERLVRLLLNRWVRRSHADPPTWSVLLAQGISKPISLFILAYGSYGALSPLFSHNAQRGIPQTAYRVIQWGTDIVGSVAALWFLFQMLHLIEYQIRRWARSHDHALGSCILSLTKRYRSPVKFLILLVFCRMISPLVGLGSSFQAVVAQIFGLLLIAAVTWLILASLEGLEEFFLSRYRMDVADNLQARKMHTQVRFLKRLVISVVLVLAGSSMLMMFDKVRQLGTSILASAGIAGVVVGLAAQRSIANILVGLQIALTQPFRLDDVVIVENEWGRIEEITTTYVVIKLWDLRRLIVPTSYFTEKPFQNWTRVSAELLGTVFLYTDYTVPVEAVRAQLKEVLTKSPWWNGKVGEVQVTDASPQGMKLRLLTSSDNASASWNLRCEVREKMIHFLQERFPESLPKLRAELQDVASTASGRPGVPSKGIRDFQAGPTETSSPLQEDGQGKGKL